MNPNLRTRLCARVSIARQTSPILLLLLVFASACVDVKAAPRSLPHPDKPTSDGPPTNILDLPARNAARLPLVVRLQLSMQQQQHETSRKLADELLAAFPDRPAAIILHAVTMQGLGEPDTALDSFERAAELGWADTAIIEKLQGFDAVLNSKRWTDLKARIAQRNEDPASAPVEFSLWTKQPEPIMVNQAAALINEVNLGWSEESQMLISRFEFPERDPTAIPEHAGEGTAGLLLKTLQKQQTAAGLHGVLYDNVDHGHSMLPLKLFSELTPIRYAHSITVRKMDHGLQTHFLHQGAIVLGNSSTAYIDKVMWRSCARMTVSDTAAAFRAHQHYVNNHIYVYPEHRDFDANTGDASGYGDVFPAYAPFLVVSKGSSGSDRPHLVALATTLGAFRPDVRAVLQQKGLFAPITLMILRRCLSGVESDEDYRSAKAHPIVIPSDRLKPEAMVRMANEITAKTIPPYIQIRIVNEDLSVPWIGHADPFNEPLITTPSVIARVHRGLRQSRRMVVQAVGVDVNESPVTFHWRILQGEEKGVEMRPLNDDASQVELTIPWPGTTTIAGLPDMTSHRIDIAVFADNGSYHSAPAVISVMSLANEYREYDENGLLLVLDHAHPEFGGNYVDPVMLGKKNWRDEFHYEDGILQGWTRTSADIPMSTDYSADGMIVASRDDQGRPELVHPPDFNVRQLRSGGQIITVRAADRTMRYEYPQASGIEGRKLVPIEDP